MGPIESPEWTDDREAFIGRDNALRPLPRLAARIQSTP